MKSCWQKFTIGNLCDSISDTYKNNDSRVILINTSDVFEGNILNHELVENKNVKGQFKKTFKKMTFYILKFDLKIDDLHLLVLKILQNILHLQN